MNSETYRGISLGVSFSGTSDFIDASYVRGGPLMNTFICTQAPLPNTQVFTLLDPLQTSVFQGDFWNMVWQERSEMIIMLCGAVDTKTLGPLDKKTMAYCPYYWPRLDWMFWNLMDL